MNEERSEEWETIREKTEAARRAFDRVEYFAMMVRVGLDLPICNDDELATQRQHLGRLCRELIEDIEALEKHAHG